VLVPLHLLLLQKVRFSMEAWQLCQAPQLAEDLPLLVFLQLLSPLKFSSRFKEHKRKIQSHKPAPFLAILEPGWSDVTNATKTLKLSITKVLPNSADNLCTWQLPNTSTSFQGSYTTITWNSACPWMQTWGDISFGSQTKTWPRYCMSLSYSQCNTVRFCPFCWEGMLTYENRKKSLRQILL